MLFCFVRLQFKAYVYKLRGKNDEYRRKKGELSSLRAEVGILSRTDEVLTQRNDEIDRKIVSFHLHRVALYCDVYLCFDMRTFSQKYCCGQVTHYSRCLRFDKNMFLQLFKSDENSDRWDRLNFVKAACKLIAFS